MNLIMLRVYVVKKDGVKWCVFRPDGSKVNEASHDTKAQAERQLNYLVAYGYCRSEK